MAYEHKEMYKSERLACAIQHDDCRHIGRGVAGEWERQPHWLWDASLSGLAARVSFCLLCHEIACVLRAVMLELCSRVFVWKAVEV